MLARRQPVRCAAADYRVTSARQRRAGSVSVVVIPPQRSSELGTRDLIAGHRRRGTLEQRSVAIHPAAHRAHRELVRIGRTSRIEGKAPVTIGTSPILSSRIVAAGADLILPVLINRRDPVDANGRIWPAHDTALTALALRGRFFGIASSSTVVSFA